MNMQDWHDIQRVFKATQSAAMHCSIATVDEQLQPNISPIGSLFLHEQNFSGFFFDCYAESFEQNLKHNDRACIQAVNSSRLFWLKSLLQGRFQDYPGVRLYAKIGALRPAATHELAAIQRRIHPLAWTKGSQLIWSDFTHVREFSVQDFRWVKYPKMMPEHS